MMKIFLSLLIVAVTAFSVQAQQISLGEISRLSRFNKLIDEVNNGKEKIKYSDIKGIPYYKAGFEDAKFGDTPTVAPIRYNTFLDTVEILVDTGIYEIPREATPAKFIFTKTNEKLVVVDTHDDYAGYFFEITDGRHRVLKKITSKFYDAVPSKNSFVAGTPARFERQRPIYFIQTESSVIKIPKNAKDLVMSFPDKKDALNDFLKINKIKLTEESDLVKLAQFLNN